MRAAAFITSGGMSRKSHMPRTGPVVNPEYWMSGTGASADQAGLLSLDDLDDYLMSDASPPKTDFALSDLDGFLTGIIVGPTFVDPRRWLGRVFGGRLPGGLKDPLGEAALATIIARYNDLSRTLADAPQRFAPLFWKTDDDIVIAADWCEGFLDAIKLEVDAWAAGTDDPDLNMLLMPILIHCGDERGASLIGLPPDIEAKALENAYHAIPPTVCAIRDYWMPTKSANAARDAQPKSRRPKRPR
jgi:uncharacterized protein